jgi:hypothetical protein
VYIGDAAIGGACLQRRIALSSCWSSTMTTIQTPIWPLPPSKGVQCIHLLRPSSLVLETHLTLAVTPRPSPIAPVSSSLTWSDPPILFRNGDCRMPGTRNDGDANKILSEGYGRTSKYYQFRQHLACLGGRGKKSPLHFGKHQPVSHWPFDLLPYAWD